MLECFEVRGVLILDETGIKHEAAFALVGHMSEQALPRSKVHEARFAVGGVDLLCAWSADAMGTLHMGAEGNGQGGLERAMRALEEVIGGSTGCENGARSVDRLQRLARRRLRTSLSGTLGELILGRGGPFEEFAHGSTGFTILRKFLGMIHEEIDVGLDRG